MIAMSKPSDYTRMHSLDAACRGKEDNKEYYQCRDCNKMCSQRRVLHVRRIDSPWPHWKEYCKACKKYKNPNTGLFDSETLTREDVFGTHTKQNKRDDK